jgi:peptidylprolyl isomerase
MPLAKRGDTVSVHYTGSLSDGTVFDSSAENQPLMFTIGEGQVIFGFEEAVIGMAKGESKTTTLAAEDAFGPYKEELLVEVGRDMFSDHLVPEVGKPLTLRGSDGNTAEVIVADVGEASVTLDANHPLAGEDVVLDIELIEILDPLG